jgi:autotransporter-associated beta strand protein
VIAGDLNFPRAGNTTTTLTSAQTYTGVTTVRGGTLQLRDSATLASTAGLNLEFGILNIDNAGTAFNSAPANLADRILASNAISTRGGTITLTGIQGETVTEALGTVTVLGGQSTITATPGNTGTSLLTIDNLIRSAGSGVNFTSSNNNLGQRASAGVIAIGSGGIVLTQLNTAAPTLTNGILGGWATVNGTDFAGYVTPGATQGGVGPVGAAGYGSYVTTALSTAAIPAASNVTVAANVTALAQTINSLRVSAASTITQTAATTITLGSGGLLLNGAASVITGGDITSGGAELFAYANNTATISSRITGAGVTLVKNGPSTLTLASPLATQNSYAGGTIVNAGTLTLGGAAGTIQIPASGGLTINNATVTMATNAGQIANGTNITINGGGILNYVGNNTSTGTLSFNNQGGTGNSAFNATGNAVASTTVAGSNIVTVAVAGLATGMRITGPGIPEGATITAIGTGNVTISTNATASAASTLNYGAVTFGAGNTIVAVNDSFATSPSMTGGFDLAGGATTFNTTGLSPTSLIVSGVLSNGSVVKTGTGGLIMSGAGTYTGGTDLQAGSLILGGTTLQQGRFINGVLGLGTLTISGDSTKLMAANTTVYNAINVTNPSNTLTLGGTTGANNILLAGALTFAGGPPNTISVDSPAMVAVLQSTLTGSFAFTKAGPGLLTLSNPANTYTGVTTISNGTLGLGNSATNGTSRFSEIAVGSAGTFDIRGLNTNTGSITGTGLVTNTGGAVTLATGFDNTNFTFSGQFGSANQISANFNLNKIGTGTMTIDAATGNSTFSIGTMTVSKGGVTLNGAGQTEFGTYTVLQNGTLTLDNSVTNVNNRLGGPNRAVNLQGGELVIIGNAAAPTTETIHSAGVPNVGVLTFGNGNSRLTLQPNAAQPLTLSIGRLGDQPGAETGLIRGTGLGNAPGNGVATVLNIGNVQLSGGGVGDGSNQIGIRPDILGDTNAAGLGTGFLTYSTGRGFRPLAASELSPGLFRAFATNSNVAVSGSTLFGTATVNSLTLNAGSSFTGISNVAQLTPSSGGILTFDASGGFNGGLVNTGGNQVFFHQLDTVNALNFDSYIQTSNQVIKSGGGDLNILRPQYFTNSNFVVNAGNVNFNSGADNTLAVIPGAATPTLTSLVVNAGTVDLLGRNQAVNGIGTNNFQQNSSGTITNSGANATFTVTVPTTTTSTTTTTTTTLPTESTVPG